MILKLLSRQLYITDNGTVKCNDKDCRCEGEAIQTHGRRMSLGEYLLQLEKHWEEYGDK